MTPEQSQEILALRTQRLTPKEIARKLGLRPAEVAAIIHAEGEQAAQDRLARGEVLPIYECLVTGEFPEERFLPAGKKPPRKLPSESQGLTIVVVARQERPGKLITYSYLVDYFCLGIKDVIGPKTVSEQGYRQLKAKIYSAFSDQPRSISLEQAQAIVLSSLAYAEKLGLSPHADFTEAARQHLGTWDQQIGICCGNHEGKPMFIAGPYDSPRKIMSVLDRSIGRKNYHFIAPADMF